MKKEILRTRLPIIILDPSSVFGAELFNPNSWNSNSESIIQSCWTEYSILHTCVVNIDRTCNNTKSMCNSQIAIMQEQWNLKPFNLEQVIIYAQQPELHIYIEAFFSVIKTLLDLLAQLLYSEKIISTSIHGFKRAQDEYGGTVLKALKNNTPNINKEIADKLHAFIIEQKSKWIDQAIKARDNFIHPPKGFHQQMFELEFKEGKYGLVCEKIDLPRINQTPINTYAQQTLNQISEYSKNFLCLLKAGVIR